MSTRKVVVTDYTFPHVDQERAAAERHRARFEAFQCRHIDEVAQAVEGADVVAVQFVEFSERAIARLAPNATIIRYGIGYDNIDLAAASARSIRVGYVPDYCIDEVADHTTSMILALLRKLVPLDRSVRSAEWAAVKHASPMKPFKETTIGFLGLGRIGQSVMERLRPCGFKFIAAEPAMSDEQARALGVERVDIDALFRRADALSLHAPATDETTEIVNAASLSKMKSSAVIVNTARGKLINENALAQALTDGVIAGAALDVFKIEPLPTDSPLRAAPNLLLTPHAAWFSDAAVLRLQQLVADDIERALRNEAPRRPVPGTYA